MSEKDLKKLTQDDAERMKKAIGEMNEEELSEVVGAGGDVNPETTVKCVTWAVDIAVNLWTNRPFCK